MNYIVKKSGFIISLMLLLMVAACDDDRFEITEFDTDRLFRPIDFEATMNKTVVTLKWATVKDAVSYTLQISQDSLFATIPYDVTLFENQYVIELAGSTRYFARVRANAADDNENSGFNSRLSFNTPSENLFQGYQTAMSAMNAITVNWLPGANVTAIVLTTNETPVSYDVTDEESDNGSKTITGLANATYTVQLMNGTIVRGTLQLVVEGDVYLTAGQSLIDALNTASAGQVIVLEPGALFLTGSSTYRFDKNIKVRGLTPTNLPVIAMTSGTPTATTSMFNFVENSVFDYLHFENVDITGFCDNDPSAVKIGYIFNNNVMTTVQEVRFTNSIIRNLGNTPFRVQANRNQVIENLYFNRCTIYDIAFSSTYAIVNSNSADFINNIYFNNTTAYNFRGSLVLRQNQSFGEIVVSNCNINQGMMDMGSVRMLIDTNNANATGSGITIRNSIFGSSGERAAGVRMTSTNGALVVVNSYYTNDYIDQNPVGDVNYSQKSKMTAYPNASTDLWNNPLNGDFTLKDKNFAGSGTVGDLRWY